MKRDKIVTFVLGFVAGVVLIVPLSTILLYTMNQRFQQDLETAAAINKQEVAQRQRAEEQVRLAQEKTNNDRLLRLALIARFSNHQPPLTDARINVLDEFIKKALFPEEKP